jgi:pimeloyl-ACP methyl ester carboxylesterase
MAAVARGLADAFRVLEPFQRGSGGEPLTVAWHVADLHELIQERCAGTRPAIVGSSWGAMLALAYAAAHPDAAGPLVLIGCGTFDLASRARMQEILATRMTDEMKQRMEQIASQHADANEAFQAVGNFLLPVYSFDPATTDLELEPCDVQAYEESWSDMVRLQQEGVYPATFAAIHNPVLMIHGAADPHPGQMIRASLLPFLPQLVYLEWEKCGHYPWIETHIRDEFFTVLRQWLTANLGAK